ncbi:MAG TPA: hypothetical protein VGR56_01985 [Nitrososphaerales archaeon]|nr:hypothetical protein [Nitrososphaerales archaeon]
MNEVCESVISEVLGSGGGGSASRWFVRSGVGSTDCCRRPQEFDDALVDSFQPIGALLIETKILTRFYGNIGAKYQRGDSLSFADEIKKARLLFEEKQETGIKWKRRF